MRILEISVPEGFPVRPKFWTECDCGAKFYACAMEPIAECPKCGAKRGTIEMAKEYAARKKEEKK